MGYQIVYRSPAIGSTPFSGFGEPPPAAATKRKSGLAPFKLVCDGKSCGRDSGCGSLAPDFRKRVLGAIELARNAAAKLKTPDQKTRDAFRDVFGQDINHPWEQPGRPREKMAAGKMAAERFEKIQKELQTRHTIYRCLSRDECINRFGRVFEVKPSHPTELTIPDLDLNALAVVCNDEVLLCPPFWKLKPEWQEGTILHEMFHLCFALTCAWFQHDQNERPRNSAYCYEVFALRLAKKSPPQTSIDNCKAVLSRIGQP